MPTWMAEPLSAHQDWALVRRAINDGYVLVTNNRADFTSLMEREPDHPGLVCINMAHGLMSLTAQQALFKYALGQVTDYDLSSRMLCSRRSD